MLDPNDPSILWVSASAGDGNGTRDNPFESIVRALAVVRPGQTIVLLCGEYADTVTIEISGTLHQPVRIMADPNGRTVVKNAWFLYDTSDLIISGFTFSNVPAVALSVIGACERNRFENLAFIECGHQTASSTLFFGGSGGRCNVVENCSFERAELTEKKSDAAVAMSIGLMVGEGDESHGEPIRDCLIRLNRFVNYDYGILVGTSDDCAGRYGHIVEYNTIESCGVEGILVKSGDTQVRGNIVKGCRKDSITIGAGSESVVEQNRIVDCARGIIVYGDSHTVTNNCIVRCGGPAIRAAGTDANRPAASNLFVENNTCVDCGTVPDTPAASGIVIDKGTSCIVRKNLVSGQGVPCSKISEGDPVAIVDNLMLGRFPETNGFSRGQADFLASGDDDFANDSGYGAAGWVLGPGPAELAAESDDTRDYRHPESDDDAAFDDEDAAEVEAFIEGMFLGPRSKKHKTGDAACCCDECSDDDTR